ncbi:hypothetical protein CH063_00395 [Colletotrichum higginsianum]|uniref:Uncharacterized protein n=1 Tax=Colletotrichum higginsianum (strain IMI 349063) TaxID=759273 RepID=H1VMF1_COLHI|nr:hypothetical protein CH63R_03176 [Colletotrichum higginsianum IMI 349063]OBR14450.1 hypothetical protein CH63R_03176 [Colletotrichum higginsianum IMI 349063]CCF41405.1 hypothetical protein CH063_00395 [Colletotrichum higginsianum]
MSAVNSFTIRRKPVGKGNTVLEADPTVAVSVSTHKPQIVDDMTPATATGRPRSTEHNGNPENLHGWIPRSQEGRPITVHSPSRPTTSSTSDSLIPEEDGQVDDGNHPRKDVSEKQQHEGHVSFYFSRLFLVGIATTFVLMIVALELLNLFSKRNKGLAPVDERNHYLWTYGPTFVLTLFVALWGQLEHRTKHLMPWMAMSNGPVDAPQGLLLDYITPMTISSLFKSAKRKHFLVTLGILGSLALRALVVVSTGLLSVEQQTMAADATITVLDQFNLSRNLRIFAVDAGVTIWGVHHKGVAYPPGTTEKVAAQSFLVSGYVFEADFESCYEFSWAFPQGNLTKLSLEKVASEPERAVFDSYCELNGGGSILPVLKEGPNFFVRTNTVDKCAVEERDEDSSRVYASIIYNMTSSLVGATTMFCKPKYTLTRRNVTIASNSGQAGRIIAVDDEILEHMSLEGTPAVDITNFVVTSISSATQLLSRKQGVPFSTTTLWWSVMNFTDPQPTRADLGHVSRFPDLFRRVFKTVAAISVKERRIDSISETVPGGLRHESNRLVVEEVSLRVMQSLLTLLAVISLAFCFFPLTSLPTRSGFMLTLASILNHSPQLLRVLENTGKMNKLWFRRRLSNFRFYLLPGNNATQVTIGVQPKKARLATPSSKAEDASPEEQWWKPMAAGIPYKSSLIAITVAVVVTLEVLLQQSIKHGGLATVSTDGYTKYSWLFVPALITGGLALAYNAVDTTNRLLHPFQQLRAAKGPNLLAMRYDPLGKVTMTATAHALRNRYLALAAGMLTSLLGPLLTIAASGLFSPSLVPGSQRVEVRLTGWFDVSTASLNDSMYLGSTNTDSVLSQAILFNNASYMKGTYETFVFPQIELPAHLTTSTGGNNASTNGSSGTSSLAVRLPAVRGQLNCTKYASFRGQQYYDRKDPLRHAYMVPIDPPPNCVAPSRPQKITDGRDRSKLLLTEEKGSYPNEGSFAWQAERWWSRPVDGVEIIRLVDHWSPFDVCMDGRQHIFFTFGHHTDPTTNEVHVLHCMPYLESVTVDAKFSLPDLESPQDAADAPVAVEETARTWDSGPGGDNSVTFPDLVHVSLGSSDGPRVDAFFQALTTGKDAVPLAEIANVEAVNETMAKMNRLYQILVAQSVSEHFRSGVPGDGTVPNGFLPVVDGDIIDVSRVRLLQSPISTRILEGLLLTMLACSLVVFALAGPAGILPKNPGSIASRMSLLANSTLLDHMDTADDFGTSRSCIKGKDGVTVVETEADRQEFFGEDTLSLGWWHSADGGNSGSRYGIDIGLADSRPR